MPLENADNKRYAEDKPSDCNCCFFWKKTKGCERSECYYLLPADAMDDPQETSQEKESCRNCPYGKHSPCIGYCLKDIIREMKLKI